MILTRNMAAKLANEAKEQGKIIVFTNGCFDIIHAGHVTYLNTASKLGDVLIVGLNSDASVRRLKGERRPLNDESDRATVLDALSSVDYVTIFDEDTPLELINQITPNILVKGGDYKAEDIVGANHVINHGGKVEIISFVDGKSTTNIINKMIR